MTSPHRHLRVTREGSVQTITLCNVTRRNAQTPSMWVALAELAANLDRRVRVVVLNADGSSFSSGIDRAMLTPQGVEGEESLLEVAAQGPEPMAEAIAPFQQGFTGWADTWTPLSSHRFRAMRSAPDFNWHWQLT